MGMVYGIGQIWNVHYQTRPWIFQMGHTGVFINRGTPKWTVYNGISKNPSINGWFGGYAYFRKPPYLCQFRDTMSVDVQLLRSRWMQPGEDSVDSFCDWHTLWLCQHSYWTLPFIVDLPIDSMVIFHRFLYVYQRVPCAWCGLLTLSGALKEKNSAFSSSSSAMIREVSPV